MEKKIDPKGKEKKQTRRNKWYKAVCSMAAVVVVCTVYTLMLPALTLDEDSAGDAGVTISESAVPTSESPAAESSTDNTAADSSADSSPADTESGPAAAAPSDDSAPSQDNEITTLPSQDGENNIAITLPTEENNTGAITGNSESQDEINNEENKDENDGSPAADKEEADNSDSDSSSDAADDEDTSDPTADIEDASIWEATIPDLSDYATWADKLVAVAQSQLGYKESALNFTVDTNGEHKGYTRYGAWYKDGNPYGDWCAMFVSFCLNYAGIENNESIIPYNANCQTWVEDLTTNKIFEDPDTYLPEPGDIVFFDQKGNGKANHVGIVSDVEYGTKTVKRHVVVGTETAVEESPIALFSFANSLISEEIPVETLEATETEVTVAKNIEVIEGNSSDQVQTVTYDITDDSIIGFASMLEAEYINDGGNIDDIKNADQTNQPVTLEDRIATQATIRDVTVEVGKSTTIGYTQNYCDRYRYGNHHKEEWSIDDPSKVEISTSMYYGQLTVTGKAVGTTNITHKYCSRTWNGSQRKWDYSHEQEETIKVTVSESYINAAIYYLATPDGYPESNDTTYWAPTSDLSKLFGKINVTNASWEDGHGTENGKPVTYPEKNITSNVSNYIISWPDGSTLDSWTIGKDSTATITENGETIKIFDYILDSIWSSYKPKIEKDTGLSNVNKSDITSITLNPFKISRNNYTTNNQPYHIDCTIDVVNPSVMTARFLVKQPNATEYGIVDAKNYVAGSTITKTAAIKDSDLVKIDNNSIIYYFDGWYNERNEKVSDENGWPYLPDKSEYENDSVVNFYAHYVSATVYYAVGTTSIGHGTVSDPTTETYVSENAYENLINESGEYVETTIGSTPKAEEGWVFEGWYKDAACTDPVEPDWVDENGKIIPKKNTDNTWDEVAGETYYAKFVSSVQLPETGGPGTTLLYLLGAMLIIAPLTITFIKRRKQENEEN